MKRAMVALVVALGLATVAHAGLRNTVGVTVDTVNHKAFGALGEARNSADAIQAAGCQTSIVAGGTYSLLCFAVDATGVEVMCTSTNKQFIQTAQALGTDAAFAFSYDPTNGTCKTLLVFNASEFGPKLP